MPELNFAEINRIADLLENQHYSPGEMGFFMGTWFSYGTQDVEGHPCGTTACIAGWTNVMNGNSEENWGEGNPQGTAARTLGLTERQARLLFHTVDWSYGNREIESVRTLHAVETLRHLAATGCVDWREGERRYQKRMREEETRKEQWKLALHNLIEQPKEISNEAQR